MAEIKEITASELDPIGFINEQVVNIKNVVGTTGQAINALSGGVDSSTVTILGHRALGDNLTTVFVDNGLMRDGEPEKVVADFAKLGINVILVDAQDEFFAALEGITDPEKKREAIAQTFYKDVFGDLVRESGAKHLLQGTNLTDVDETVAGIKRQHNVFKQLGIDPEEAFGYEIIEPLLQLRKDGVRAVAKAVGLPQEIYERLPFPGPALAARVMGLVTREKIELVRQATVITEEILKPFEHFQSMTILHEDRATGMVDNDRRFGRIIQIRCWASVDARAAVPVELPWGIQRQLGERIPSEIQGVTQATMNLTAKPPATMEAL